MAVHSFKLGHTLQNNAYGNVTGANYRDDFIEIRYLCACGKVVHNDTDGNFQSPLRTCVSIAAKYLQSLCVKDIYKLVKGSVSIADVEEQNRFFVSET